MKTTRRLSILLTLLVLIGCRQEKVVQQQTAPSGTAPSQQQVQVVNVGMFSKALSYTPLYVAQHRRLLENDPRLKGYRFEFTEYNDRPAIVAALTAEKLDILFSAEIPAIMCEAQGTDLTMIGLSNTAQQRVLVRSDLKISKLSDLRGKRLAVLPGTSSHFALLKLLRAAGLSETKVALQYMPPPEAKAAFETKRLDAWAVWAPFAEQQEVSGAGREIGDGASVHSIVTARSDYTAQHRDVVDALTSTLEASKSWIQANKAEAIKIAATATRQAEPVIAQAWPKFDWAAQVTPVVVDDLQEKAQFLADNEKTRAGRVVDIRKELWVSTR